MEGRALLVLVFVTASVVGHDIRIGVLLPPEEENGAHERIVEHVFRQGASSLQVERLEGDQPFHYHKAACRLRRTGCCAAVLSPSCDPLPGQVVLACPGVPFFSPQAVGMRPDTWRATLDLMRDLGWQEIIYLQDNPHGGEKLQWMFRVGYSVLKLRVSGLLRASSAQEAAAQLLQLEGGRVLLDVAPQLAAELLARMAHAGRTQHSFLVMQPTVPDFWRSAELRALDVVGFSLERGEEKLFGQPATVESLYFHDAALFLASASAAGWRSHPSPRPIVDASPLPPECDPAGGASPPDRRIADILQTVVVSGGTTGPLQFSDGQKRGSRTNVTLKVMKTSRQGPVTYGWWSNGGKLGGIRKAGGGVSLPQQQRLLRITTRLSAPFMMSNNGTGFEGFCADLASALCAALLPLECRMEEAPDGREGSYDPKRGTWDGMMGELLSGRADVALGELQASAGRARAVHFLPPFLATSLSLLLARPSPHPLPLSWGVWGAALGAALVMGLALHALGRLSGAPDSIEASSALWERRTTPLISAWHTLGSALLQPTGVYPRSLSSRVLAGSWFAFTGFLACMLVASMAAQLQLHHASDSPQLRQLQALSLEAVLAESLENGWPEIGVVSPSFTENVIQESTAPLLVRVRGGLRRVASLEEGAALAAEGGFALLTESPWAEWAVARRPCRLVAVHGVGLHGALAPALAHTLDADIKESVRAAFEALHSSGHLGHLYRKWWIENSQCKEQAVEVVSSGGLSSNLLILLGAAFVLLLLSFAAQFSRKIRTKESRRQQLTFDDINFDQRLPTPPPELLAPPVLEVPQIEGGGEESFKDFFDRMRTSP